MICLCLGESTLELNRELVERNREYIDLCELRVDRLSSREQKQAARFPAMVDIPVILTIRRVCDGGSFHQTERTRKDLFLRALEGDFAYIDIEDDIKRNDVEEKAREKGVKIIRSLHDMEKVPEDIFSRVYHLAERGDVAKIAVRPNGFADVMTLFRIKEELKGVDKIIIGLGEYGVVTRILYRLMGSMLTFASDNQVAPGQISARKLKLDYRADQVNEKTAVYGIIGNPVLNSASPLMHNRGFQSIRFNAIYVPFLVDDVRLFFSFAEQIRIRGFSVTVPFKVDVLSYLGNITREVKQIGSCNTVVRVPGMWKGINTDYYGFIRPIARELDNGEIESALVIGAGGASHAIVWALRNRGVKVTILNRTLSHAEKIAKMNLCDYDTLDNAADYAGKVDLIVQTTSVGLYPNFDGNPIAGFPYTGREIVYDIIYKPRMTKVLQEAEKAGCRIHFGSEMLIDQGKLQFEAFTGYHYPDWVDPGL